MIPLLPRTGNTKIKDKAASRSFYYSNDSPKSTLSNNFDKFKFVTPFQLCVELEYFFDLALDLARAVIISILSLVNRQALSYMRFCSLTAQNKRDGITSSISRP